MNLSCVSQCLCPRNCAHWDPSIVQLRGRIFLTDIQRLTFLMDIWFSEGKELVMCMLCLPARLSLQIGTRLLEALKIVANSQYACDAQVVFLG